MMASNAQNLQPGEILDSYKMPTSCCKLLFQICRMQEVQSSSGLTVVSQKLQDFLHADLFDEDTYDKAMQDAFNEAYYQVSHSPRSPDIIL